MYKNVTAKLLLKTYLCPKAIFTNSNIIKITQPIISDLMNSVKDSFILFDFRKNRKEKRLSMKFVSFLVLLTSIYYLQFFCAADALSNPHFGEKGVSGLKVAKSPIAFSICAHIGLVSVPQN